MEHNIPDRELVCAKAWDTHTCIVGHASHIWLNSVGVSGKMARDVDGKLDRKQMKESFILLWLDFTLEVAESCQKVLQQGVTWLYLCNSSFYLLYVSMLNN